MKIVLPEPVLDVLNALSAHDYEAHVVGGAVRDLLLRRPTTDWDIATNAHPDKIQAILPKSFYHNQFGTVGVPSEELGVIDVTTYRFEFGYSDKRRPDRVEWGTELEDDLSRRDFTINALAMTSEGKIIDLFNGQDDVNNRLIRAVGEPKQRFQEDALRMMRAIRFGAQLHFEIEGVTLAAIQDSAKLIQHVSWERIRDELLKIIESDYPAEGILLLYNAGLLEHILPELLPMRGVKQGGHHIHDVWKHSLEALRGCPSSDPIVRLATLLHDVGKPRTVRYQGPRGVTFYGHEVVGARMAQKIGERLRLPTKELERLVILVRWHMFAYSREMTDGAIRRFIRNVGLININDMMLLRVGDRKGGGSKATSWRLNELQQRIGEQLYEPMNLKDLKVTGSDVMEVLHITPSKQVGHILNQLFEEVIEDSSKNNREYLLKRIESISAS